MVPVYVRIPESMDIISRPEAAHLCHHQGKQGIRGNIEGDAQENIGTALV
jgi:hypothetical protein